MRRIEGRRRRRAAALPAALLLAACLAGCSRPERPEILPSGTRERAAAAAARVVDEIEGRNPGGPSETRVVVVDAVSIFRNPDFTRGLVNAAPQILTPCVDAVVRMLTFPGPWGGAPREVTPSMMKAVNESVVRAFRAAPARGKRQFMEDLEVFMVFHAAWEAMNRPERDRLMRRWVEAAGTGDPPRPAARVYPLAWLRGDPVLWPLGGRAWWWARAALVRDSAFAWSKAEGAEFTLEDGTTFISWRPD